MKKITKEDVKNWAKTHKKELLIAGGAAAGVVGLYIFNKSSASIPIKGKLITLIQHSIVWDNKRSHTISMSCNTTAMDWDKAVAIFDKTNEDLCALVTAESRVL